MSTSNKAVVALSAQALDVGRDPHRMVMPPRWEGGLGDTTRLCHSGCLFEHAGLILQLVTSMRRTKQRTNVFHCHCVLSLCVTVTLQ